MVVRQKRGNLTFTAATCLLASLEAAGAGTGIASYSLHRGDVPKGETIRWWARLSNTGPRSIRVSELPRAAIAATLPPPVDVLLVPGAEAVFELWPIHTSGFQGPVTRTVPLFCSPACTLAVALTAAEPPDVTPDPTKR